MKKLLIFALFVIIVGSVMLFSKFNKKHLNLDYNYNRILYSWKLNEVEKDSKKFYSILDEYDINVIYQDFTSEYLIDDDSNFIMDMNKRNIKVFHLAGDPSWGQKNGSEMIIKEIFKVHDYNSRVLNKLEGIVLDIEPYVSEKEEVFAIPDFQIYVNQIKEAYLVAKSYNIKLILAIPYWFDNIDINLLEELIKYSDGVSVMNYGMKKTSEHIKNEIILAKKHNKDIDTIYEVEYGEKDYFESSKDILDDYYVIKEKNDYKSLGIAYHHFGSM